MTRIIPARRVPVPEAPLRWISRFVVPNANVPSDLNTPTPGTGMSVVGSG